VDEFDVGIVEWDVELARMWDCVLVEDGPCVDVGSVVVEALVDEHRELVQQLAVIVDRVAVVVVVSREQGHRLFGDSESFVHCGSSVFACRRIAHAHTTCN